MLDKVYQVLEETWAESTFNLIHGPQQIIVQNFQSGSAWSFSLRTSDTDPWIDLDLDFSGDGVKRFEAIEDVIYRVHGGVVGAEIFVVPVFGGFSPKDVVEGP